MRLFFFGSLMDADLLRLVLDRDTSDIGHLPAEILGYERRRAKNELDLALKLLSLPRVVGVDPQSNEEITAQNGRYGPYLKRGNDSRSLATEDQIFDITLDEALKIYAEPKRRGGQGASAPPLRELGTDLASGKPMVIKDGRFGPYVTDGETNASLRKGDDVLSITDERAAELLADRRARGPAKRPAKKTTRKAPAKKAPRRG